MASLLCLLAFPSALVPHDPAPIPHPEDLDRLARRWEPQLYADLPSLPPPFAPNYTSPCLRTSDGILRCVPGAFLLGGWQCGARSLGALLASHPDLQPVGNDGCFGAWRDDSGARRWLRRAPPPAFEPRRQLLAALGCVTALQFYPGFAGRFHKVWEEHYWPCKARCMATASCAQSYYDTKQWRCKAAALRAHDAAVRLPPAGDGSAAVNATPPYMMLSFYRTRVKLLALLRSPIDRRGRLRHAFYAHVHYPKRYGRSAEGLHSYVLEQVGAWEACAARFGRFRCAIHFEQLGKEQSDVFFHCDQLIRSMYSPFARDWLAAFPRSLLFLRTEDLYADATSRQQVLRQAWTFMGLVPPTPQDEHTTKVEKRLRAQSYRSWTTSKGPIHQATARRLQSLFAPFNRELRDMLEKNGISCTSSADCDRFLWAGLGEP
ncbi:hypothetical protein AB1Y20_001708 [Prymnesium parvum]|uniref:Sulfotransferase n=1 Tax=Prymnesium parvum TaxID=97485 RepID=A0AB34KBM7_PRYPA